MKKDVVYIDVEDDITAIIEKVKKAKEKIVALVPPKRVGVLQSAVNLRLLARTADGNDKKIVLITNNQTLVALAASAAIPVAKNLQSKPEIPEIAALQVDDDDDMIDGQQLPVGDHAKTAGSSKLEATEKKAKVDKSDSEEAFDDINIDDESLDETKDDTGKKINFKKGSPASKTKKTGVKIPNFDSFRNKLFIGIAAAILLTVGLVWAFVFAPAAKVIVTANTSTEQVSFSVNLTDSTATSLEDNKIQYITKSIEKESEVEFTATGKATVGDKATGTMEITRTSISNIPLNVPAGTRFTSGAYTFVSTQATTLGPTDIGGNGLIQDTKEVPVEAVDIGADYNLPSRNYQPSMNGFSARGSNMSGGSSREVTVATQEDFDKAIAELDEISDDEAKEELYAEFKNGEVIIKDSLKIDRSAPVSVPALGKEVSGDKAKIVLKAKYTVLALPKTDVQDFLKDRLNKLIENESSQRIYDDGIDSVALNSYFKSSEGETVNIVAQGKIGPNIDAEFVKNIAKGRSYGDVQFDLERINGVSEVDVQFSYFWVRTVPDNGNKIEVEFKLEEDE